MRYLKFVFLFLLLASCGQEREFFHVEGQLRDLDETLIVRYLDPSDSLYVVKTENGRFSFDIAADTTMAANVIFSDGSFFPLVPVNGESVIMDVDSSGISVSADGLNGRLSDIVLRLDSLESYDCHRVVDSIVMADPRSEINLCLLDRYYTTDSVPDYRGIRELCDKMTGRLRDSGFVIDLLERVDRLSNRGSYMGYISEPDMWGGRLKSDELRGKIVLVSFWASWDSLSVASQDSVAAIVEDFSNKPFRAVSISLDMNPNEWRAAVSNRDSTDWSQLCSFEGFNSETVEKSGITEIPSSFLLNDNQYIICRNPDRKKIEDCLKDKKKRKKKAGKKKREFKKNTNIRDLRMEKLDKKGIMMSTDVRQVIE